MGHKGKGGKWKRHIGKLKTTQTIHHGGTEKTEVVVIDLAANLIQRTDHRAFIHSVFSVFPW